MPLARIGAFPHIPPGTPGWYAAWCAFEGLSVYHPERMTPAQRARYEAEACAPAPPRNPYRVDGCHPLRLGRQATRDVDPWDAFPGTTVAQRCVAWLQAEFGARRRGTP
jgi:hypothetical protein